MGQTVSKKKRNPFRERNLEQDLDHKRGGRLVEGQTGEGRKEQRERRKMAQIYKHVEAAVTKGQRSAML